MPKISIITCTRNSEKYLRDCLESIKKQTFQDLEIIIVDGCSTDSTLEIAKSYKIEKIYTEISGGVSNAMNYGICNSEGEIISILHSDDYYYSERTLEFIINGFSSSKSNWLYGNLVQRKRNNELSKLVNECYSKDVLAHTFNIPHPTVFVKKSVYDEIGMFNESYKYAMDYDILLRISKKYEPCQLNEYLTVFREHDDSLSTKNWSKAQIESLQIQQKHAESLKVKALGYFRFIKSRLAKIKNKFK